MKRILYIVMLFMVTQLIYAEYISDEEYDSLAVVLNKYKGDTESDSIIRKRIVAENIERALMGYSLSDEYQINADNNNQSYINKILIVIKKNIYTSLQNYVIRYAHDIHNAFGCKINVYVVDGETASDIKNIIISNATNLNGAIFIGDIATIHYHTKAQKVLTSEWKEETFPCDLYYMDLDGKWELSDDESGILVGHSGNVKPEIFVGRINTANMGLNELNAMKLYFDKNHDYWKGEKIVNKKYALTFTQEDWNKTSFWNSVKPLYGADNYHIVKSNNFSKSAYLNYLQNSTYEFIQLACHSYQLNHHFSDSDDIGTYEIYRTPKMQLGYNLFCCSACDWTYKIDRPCLGESYLYGMNNNSSALAVIGSTKTGSMLGFSDFYKPLGNGKCIGEAYKSWWINHCGSSHSTSEKLWFYGMTILGDPLVNFNFTNECKEEVMINKGKEINNTYIYAQDKIIVENYSISKNYQVTLNAPVIDIVGPFECSSPANFTTNTDDRCICNSTISKKSVHSIFNSNIQNENNVSEQYMLICYPNPVKDILYVECADEMSLIEIYNISGQCVLQTNQTQIDVSFLSQGLYLLKAIDTNGQTEQTKFIKQ